MQINIFCDIIYGNIIKYFYWLFESNPVRLLVDDALHLEFWLW